MLLALVGAVAVSLGISLIAGSVLLRGGLLTALLYFGSSAALVLGIRALPRTVQDLMTLIDAPQGVPARKLLVYGAGAKALLFLRRLSLMERDPNQDIQVIGIVDDDRNLRGRYIYGYRVIGTAIELPEIAVKQQVDELIIACDLPKARLQEILEIGKQLKIVVSSWRIEQRILVPDSLAPKDLAHRAVGGRG
ncbi:MAG: hypothetical protein KDD42_07065 [Bdellovibrionales bacterium]|nr:hypothetical protein [Bdellovibrionales bacterium]